MSLSTIHAYITAASARKAQANHAVATKPGHASDQELWKTLRYHETGHVVVRDIYIDHDRSFAQPLNLVLVASCALGAKFQGPQLQLVGLQLISALPENTLPTHSDINNVNKATMKLWDNLFAWGMWDSLCNTCPHKVFVLTRQVRPLCRSMYSEDTPH